MKISKHILLAAIFCGNCIVTNVLAIDLMDVYKRAFATDPTFKAARAKFLADRENLPIAKASLLPKLSANGNLTRQYFNSEVAAVSGSGGNNDYFNNNIGYKLELVQPLFDFGNWANVWGAQADIKRAEATFLAAEQELLSRTAQAYFDVLLAKDVLYYSRANKIAVERLLNQTKHKYDVGLIAITDLENTRAKYDQAVSDEIQAVNDLSNKFEQLNEITGVRYIDLDPIKANFPLLSPQPNDIEQWVKAAEKHNFDLAAARYTAIAAKEQVKVKNAGHLPTLSASGGYNYSYNDNTNYPGSGGYENFSRDKTTSAGLALTVPIFEGGRVAATAKQADYLYQQALAEQNRSHRSTISQTRQAYLGVLSNISKIKADLQAIKSAQNSLRSTEASYTVGTRTMIEVLQVQTDLYKVQKIFADDEYKYIMQLLKLKQLVGILDARDLKQINSWLEKRPLAVDDKSVVVGKHLAKKKSSKGVKGKSEGKSQVAKLDDAKIVVLNAEEVKPVVNDDIAIAPVVAPIAKPATAVDVTAPAALVAPSIAVTSTTVPAVSTVKAAATPSS